MPRVSVVVPVFNGAETIERAIDSLIRQSLQEIEVVIVNDGSTDGTRRIIDNLANRHSKILAVHSERNLGAHQARRTGLGVASSPWIGFLDSDDVARPDMFETMAMAGEREDADIVVCGALRAFPNGRIIGRKVKFRVSTTVRSNILQKFCSLRFGTGALWNKLYKRQLIARHTVGSFPWRQDTNEDLLLNIGCFSDARSVHVLRQVLYHYVQHDRSTTALQCRQDAIVETLRAFAIALDQFSDSTEDVLREITSLFRRQFDLDYLRLDYKDAIAKRGDDIEAAVQLICQRYPEGLAQIVSRAPSERLSIGRLFAKALNRFFGIAP